MLNDNSQDLATHFLKLSRLGSTRSAMDVDDDDDDQEEPPTELNTINSSGGFLLVSPDKLSVKYPTVHMHGHDVGVVQGNRPAPVKRLVYYFEIHVKSAGVKGQIAIGFTCEGFKMRRQPGKNGAVVGTTRKDVKGRLYPTVAVHSQNEEVTVNFGADPFCFDLKVFIYIYIYMFFFFTLFLFSLFFRVVRSYLLHYGYEDTLNSFDLAGKSNVPPISLDQGSGSNEEGRMYALSQRKVLRQLIRKGKIDAALGKLGEWYPDIVQDDKSATCFLLYCQKFIELVRVGELEEAVSYGRTKLAKFFELPGFEELVQDCVALLAYEQPHKSVVGYLLEDSQREVVADTVNAMILLRNPKVTDTQVCLRSDLEKLLRQLTACCLMKRQLEGDQGEAFHLHRVLNSSDE
ncbi:hypothetical protein PVL29_024695 [Vitis rotundifolia]|uniref:CTLH domain-containing protein n=1 Tax=Vitis rotundifolia TaxID=103349 RepID=A0AA39DB62_VITRO|nr:hypothetical protein PVL29_024695 [Vitis rotundifolia]